METPLLDSFIHVGGYCFLAPQQIVRLVANRNYTLIYEISGRKLLVSTTLKVVEERLKAYGFVRISRGVVINRNLVVKVWKDGSVQLTDGTLWYPSRRRQEILKNCIGFQRTDLPEQRI